MSEAGALSWNSCSGKYRIEKEFIVDGKTQVEILLNFLSSVCRHCNCEAIESRSCRRCEVKSPGSRRVGSDIGQRLPG